MKWYKRDPDAALAGMIGLTPEERGIYNTLLDLLYSRNGDVPNNDTFMARAQQCRPQVWRRVRESLIAKGKIQLTQDGKLTANRVQTELKTAHKLMAKMGELGRVSAEKRKQNKDVTSTGPDDTTTTTTTTEAKASDGAAAPPDPSADDRGLFERGKQVLGSEAGGLIAKLLRAKGGNVSLARSVIELAATKSVPREYVGAAISRGPPVAAIDQAKATRDAKWEKMRAALRQSIDWDREGEGTGGQVLRLFP